MGLFFTSSPLGMNRRNRIIRELNSRQALNLAKDKTAFKRLLEEKGIATPHTYHEVHDYSDIRLINFFPDDFVIKPARGYGGAGVVLLKREGPAFADPIGTPFSENDVKRHIRKITEGDFSGYMESDTAIVEERIYPSPRLMFKNALGLPDIRIWCYEFEPLMAMLRYPTFKSRGKSNLTAGAVGIGLNMADGSMTHIQSKKGKREFVAEELEIPPDFAVPRWTELKALARECSLLSGLKVSGADLVLDAEDGIKVLEINGRPGLEIQNINEDSLWRRMWGQRYP